MCVKFKFHFVGYCVGPQDTSTAHARIHSCSPITRVCTTGPEALHAVPCDGGQQVRAGDRGLLHQPNNAGASVPHVRAATGADAHLLRNTCTHTHTFTGTHTNPSKTVTWSLHDLPSKVQRKYCDFTVIEPVDTLSLLKDRGWVHYKQTRHFPLLSPSEVAPQSVGLVRTLFPLILKIIVHSCKLYAPQGLLFSPHVCKLLALV